MYKVVAILASMLFSLQTFADGTLTGILKDPSFGEAVIGAEVNVYKQNDTNVVMSTFTDVDGKFEMALPQGVYQVVCNYVGFESLVKDSIWIQDNESVALDLQFGTLAKDNQLEGIIVRGTAAKDNIQSLYVQQKNASTIGDGISSDVISKSTDKNTGEVLKRISGTTIQDNKFVIVRGMNDRYNIALVDGSVLPSTEPNRKSFSFDIIPSTVVDQIVITKSGSPDLPGDYSGGAIQILTKDIPNQPYTQVSLGTSYNTLSTFKDFQSGFKSSTDILGFDDGSRQLPKDFPTFRQLQDPNFYSPSNGEQSSNYLNRLNNDYAITQRTALPALNLQLAHGRSFYLSEDRQIGINAGVTYNHEERIRPNSIRQYGNFDYTDDVYSYGTNLGALLNVGYYSKGNKILWKNLYNKVFDDKLLMRSGTNYSSTKDIQYYAFDLLQKSLLKSTLIGEHTFSGGDHILDWNLSYNLVTNNQPDQKKITYSRTMGTDEPYFADITTLGKSNNRLFGQMDEHIVNAAVNMRMPVDILGSSLLKYGLYGQLRMRSFSNRYLGAVLNSSHPGASEVVYEPLDQLYTKENINDGYYQLVDQTTNADIYDAQATTSAAYIMMENLIQDKYKLVYGVRAEHYYINLNSYTKNEVRTSWLDILPSVNLTYMLNEKTNLRASYFRSLVRPELREMANMSYYDYELDAIITGNPSLVPTRINNIDLRYEFYPNIGEIVSASVFYKNFTNTIENNLYGSNSAYDVNTKNFEGGYNVGFELELRKNLGFLSPGTIMDHFSIYTNTSIVYSQIKLPANYFIQGQLVTDRPLTGQSPLVINAGLGYTSTDQKFSANVLYNYIGKNMYMVGNDIIGHVYMNARNILDFTASYQFSERFGMKLSVKDILNSPYTFFMDQDVDGKFTRTGFVKGNPIRVDKDWVWQEYRPGTSIGLSVNYKF